jgi:hypothetical protein
MPSRLSKRRRWVIHAFVSFETSALGHLSLRLSRHVGMVSPMPSRLSTRWLWARVVVWGRVVVLGLRIQRQAGVVGSPRVGAGVDGWWLDVWSSLLRYGGPRLQDSERRRWGK